MPVFSLTHGLVSLAVNVLVVVVSPETFCEDVVNSLLFVIHADLDVICL